MSTDTVASTIRRRSDWAMVMGVVTVIVGVFMILYPFATATATTVFFGWSLLIAAIANFIFAFSAPGPGPFFVKVLLAIVYGVAGFGLVVNPLLGVAALALAAGTVLVVQSGIELSVAILYRNDLPWGWMLLDALASLALGLTIIFRWPATSIWAVGTMVGAGVLFAGITRIIVAGTIHHDVTQFERLANA